MRHVRVLTVEEVDFLILSGNGLQQYFLCSLLVPAGIALRATVPVQRQAVQLYQLATSTTQQKYTTKHFTIIFGRPFVKRFALRYRTVVLSVCNVGVLWPNGWMDQDETWHGSRTPATLC